jgi:O-antigen/teichoic acid export membrane protein
MADDHPPSAGEPSSFLGLREEDQEDLSLISRQAGFLMGGAGVGRLLGLIFNFVFARVGGEVLFGLYTLALTITNYILTLAAFGLNQALVRFVSIYQGLEDRGRQRGVLIQGGGVKVILSLLGAGTLYLLAPYLAVVVFKKPDLAVFLRWFAVSLPFLSMVNLFLAGTQGYRLMKYTPLVRDFFMPFLKLAFILILFAAGWRLYAVLTTHLSTAVLVGLFSLAMFSRVVLSRTEGEKPVFEGKMFRFTVPLFLNDLVLKGLRWSDIIFLGFFRGSGEIGIYRIAQVTSEISRVIFGSFKTAFSPVISDLHERGETEALKHRFKVISKWAFAISFPPLLFFSVMARETLGIFGPQFQAGAAALVILCLGRMVAVSTGLAANLIVMSGHSRLTLLNSLLGNFINFFLNLFLIRSYGLMGAAWAYALSVSAMNLIQLLEVRWLFGYTPYYPGYLKPLAASLVAGAGARLFFGLSDWGFTLGVLICLALFLVLYILILMFLGLPPEDRLLLREFKERIGSFKRV